MGEHRGIPTLYQGVRFRSRLEAKWAAFFDAIRWPWMYEPYDCDGYIPDFVLPFEADGLLVEVKPAHSLAELADETPKIMASGWAGEALMVGATIWDADAAQPVIGWIGERVQIGGRSEWDWGDARAFFCLSCGRPSVLATVGHWRCRACGEGHGNEHVGALPAAIGEAWATAGNRVQWRPTA